MAHRVYNQHERVHLLKSIRNILLNSKRFVLLSISLSLKFHVEASEISWSLLHNVYEKNELLPANLKKPSNYLPKLYI